jgi:hypothetical protein
MSRSSPPDGGVQAQAKRKLLRRVWEVHPDHPYHRYGYKPTDEQDARLHAEYLRWRERNPKRAQRMSRDALLLAQQRYAASEPKPTASKPAAPCESRSRATTIPAAVSHPRESRPACSTRRTAAKSASSSSDSSSSDEPEPALGRPTLEYGDCFKCGRSLS